VVQTNLRSVEGIFFPGGATRNQRIAAVLEHHAVAMRGLQAGSW
jgi:hypothetical protein